MKPRVVLALAGAAALLVAAGVTVRVASADKPSAFTAEYTQTALWDGGLIGSFIISNISGRAATGWSISFELPRDMKLAGVWNGELFASKSTYVIKPIAQTRTIAAHRSVRVGLTAVAGGPVVTSSVGARSVGGGSVGGSPAAGSPIVPRNCMINGKTCKVVVTTEALGRAPTDGFGAAPPDGSSRTKSDGSASDGSMSGALGRDPGVNPGAGHGATPVAPTSFAPAVNVTNAGRPPLTTIAEVSGARTLTLLSALPSAGGLCDLKWGGVVEPKAYAREIADALGAHVALIASIGAANGLDLARACGSAAALETQVKKILDLGLRSVDFTIASTSLADNPGNNAANARLAEMVVRLKAQYPGLTVSYSLPAAAPGGAPVTPELVSRPLLVARNAGAIIDRVNVLPVDVAAPFDVLKPLLGGVGVADAGAAGMVDSLLAAATGVHDQVMKIQGVDAATAWRMLGIIPVIGGGDLVERSSHLAGAVGRLADFAKSKGLGLVGFLPLNTGQTCLGGLVGQLLALPAIPLLSCVDSAALPGFFTITDSFNRALR